VPWQILNPMANNYCIEKNILKLLIVLEIHVELSRDVWQME
jgi:hypothetical protein